jgi:hypothetical protein
VRSSGLCSRTEARLHGCCVVGGRTTKRIAALHRPAKGPNKVPKAESVGTDHAQQIPLRKTWRSYQPRNVIQHV